jgi:O-acetylhomoserine/O-acetylserine sulfhydrylase-like pyridoxal-dependent enzyme
LKPHSTRLEKSGNALVGRISLSDIEPIRDIAYYAKKAHAVGAKLGIDATFAPPPLQNPLKWGADIVMHSGLYAALFQAGI